LNKLSNKNKTGITINQKDDYAGYQQEYYLRIVKPRREMQKIKKKEKDLKKDGLITGSPNSISTEKARIDA